MRRRVRLVLTAALILRCVAVGWWPLSGDEAYHWEWARRPDLGYFDHPPLHAWTMAVTTAIFGHNEFAVRLPSILANLGMALVLMALVRRIGASIVPGPQAERAAMWTGILATCVPLHWMLGAYATGDALVSLAWSAGLLTAWRALDEGRLRDWLLLGLALGVGILAKFLIVLLPASIAVFCLLSPTHRHWLWHWKPWCTGLVALIVATPLLWWNAQNDWATFVFNFLSRHHVAYVWWKEVPSYLAAQMAAVTPWLWLLGVGIALRSIATARAHAGLRFLACCLICPLAIFLLNAFSKRIGLHWPAVAYPALYVLVPLWWEHAHSSARARKLALALPLGLAGLLFVVALVPPRISVAPFLPDSPSAFHAKPPRVGEVLGWNELGFLVAERARAHTQGNDVFLCAAQYGFVASLAFYTPGNPLVQHWDDQMHHGQQYLRFWNDYTSLRGQDALFITRKWSRVDDNLAQLRAHFRDVGEVEAHDIIVGGVTVNRIWIIPCRGFDGHAPTWPGQTPPPSDHQ